MTIGRSARWLALFAATGALAACGGFGGDDEGGGGSGASGGNAAVTLSWLVDNSEQTLTPAKALAEAFHAKNPNITIKLETRPQGGDGDNLVKTRLATGEMNDLFTYNSGSLFQALKPEQNLVSLGDQPWVKNLAESFVPSVSANHQIYGAPFGGSTGGGILYNKKIFDQLGLEVPKTWDEFMANNAKIKAKGIAPVVQTYQDTWTSQLLMLADFHNIASQDPQWATKYTGNQAKFAQEPGLESFQRLEQVHKAGYENKDYRSAKFEQGLKELATGKGAQYPMLTFAVGAIASANPKQIDDIGFFAQPGDDAEKNGLTLWLPGATYIPKTTEGAKLDAAKKFLAFTASPEGCDTQAKAYAPSGPFLVKGCTLPADIPQAIKDIQPYVDNGNVTPALEFQSPVKGPALEQITVEVGSGLRSAASGAQLYDQDVKKQAQQLGLKGW
jgi:raffinose/stachyose/melibiose transport system substrate-binding protein